MKASLQDLQIDQSVEDLERIVKKLNFQLKGVELIAILDTISANIEELKTKLGI